MPGSYSTGIFVNGYELMLKHFSIITATERALKECWLELTQGANMHSSICTTWETVQMSVIIICKRWNY